MTLQSLKPMVLAHQAIMFETAISCEKTNAGKDKDTGGHNGDDSGLGKACAPGQLKKV